MSDEPNLDPPNDPPPNDPPPTPPPADPPPSDPPVEIPEDVLQKAVDKELAKIKGNMDKLDDKLNNVMKERDEAQAALRQKEIDALEAAGKLQEAAEKRLEESERLRQELALQNITLTRDRDIHNALAATEFRSVRAEQAATRDITDSLVQDENGKWVGKSGESLEELVQSYVKDPENDYLLKPKTNSGGGSNEPGIPNPSPNTDEELGSTSEVLALAESGKLRRRGKSLHR